MSAGSIEKSLDAAEELPVGHGQLEVSAYLQPDSGGIEANYEQRLSESLSAFGTAFGGASLDNQGTLQSDYGALAGLRWRW